MTNNLETFIQRTRKTLHRESKLVEEILKRIQDAHNRKITFVERLALRRRRLEEMCDVDRRISFCNERVEYSNDPVYKKLERLFKYLIDYDEKETEQLGVDALLPAYASCYDGKMSVRQNCEMWIRDNSYTEAHECEGKFSARAIDAKTYYFLASFPIEKIADILLDENKLKFYAKLTNADPKFAEPTILDAPLTKELRENVAHIGLKIMSSIVEWRKGKNRHVLWKGFTAEIYKDDYKI